MTEYLNQFSLQGQKAIVTGRRGRSVPGHGRGTGTKRGRKWSWWTWPPL